MLLTSVFFNAPVALGCMSLAYFDGTRTNRFNLYNLGLGLRCQSKLIAEISLQPCSVAVAPTALGDASSLRGPDDSHAP